MASRDRMVQPKHEYEIKVDGIVRDIRRIPHPVIGLTSWSKLLYVDKICSAAAELGSTVFHQRSDAADILAKHGICLSRFSCEFY